MNNPIVTAWQILGTIGIILAVWAGVSYGKFDPSISLFQQPHWWLLLLIWITNPRALAVLYICCAQPSVGDWLFVAIVGCVIVPGAWGLYFLPGLSVSHGLRIFLGFVGFFIRDVPEKALIEARLFSRT